MLHSLLTRAAAVIAIVATLLLPVSASAEAPKSAPAPISAADLFKIAQIDSPVLSPDGALVAYVVKSIVGDPAKPGDSHYRNQIWLAAVDGSSPPRQLTWTGSNTSPQWHPSGGQLAFVRTENRGRPQLYLLSLSGGEPRQLTDLPSGASAPRWSPDGSQLLFSSPHSASRIRALLEDNGNDSAPRWSVEKPGRKPNDTANWRAKKRSDDRPAASPDGTEQEIREWLAMNEAEDEPRVTTRLNFLSETDLEADVQFSQLYVIGTLPGASPREIAPSFAGYGTAGRFDGGGGAQWMPDGKSVICVAPLNPDAHPDREELRALYLVDVDSGTATQFVARRGDNLGNPTPSPDGKWIAFTTKTGGSLSFEQTMVAVVPADGGDQRILTRSLDRSVQNLVWSADSGFIYFTAASNGGFPLYRVGVNGGDVERLTPDFTTGVRDFDVGAGGLVQTITQPGNPYEIHRAALDASGSAPITSHNQTWLDERVLSKYERASFVTSEGLDIEYWTIKPANIEPNRRYPLLLEIHGGPAAMWGPGEASMWHEFQYYAARGYVVVFANPRGSGGYGRDFQRANFKDWGAGPASDVLTAATYAAKEAYVDPDRQVVTGGSYGGYLTAWIVAHDHRFKAAVAQRGVYELTTFFGEGNAWRLVPLYFGGLPWEKNVRPILERESPLTYVDRIRTPLLIQHGDVDYRTGVIQSQMLFKSLKALERPVEYVRYPRASHEMSRSGDPAHRLDSLVRYEEFFRRFLGGE